MTLVRAYCPIGRPASVFTGGNIHLQRCTSPWLTDSPLFVRSCLTDNGEILDFYPEDNDYCKIYRCYGGTYRSPEEFRCMDSNEAMDTYRCVPIFALEPGVFATIATT